MDALSLDGRLTKIILTGRLDTPGVDTIETQFVAAIVPGNKSAIVDLSGVEFIASMGIRMLISAARSMRLRQAKLVLYGAQAIVGEVFEHVSMSDVVPVAATEMDALRMVSS